MPRPWYRVRVTVGPQSWDVTSTDEPAPGPVLPLSFGWSVPDNSLGFPAQPDPASLSLGIAAPTPDHVAGIDVGSPVAVAVHLIDPAAVVTSHAVNPRGTDPMRGTPVAFWDDRWPAKVDYTYGVITNQVTTTGQKLPGGINRHARYTVTDPVNSGLGFHLAGNVDSAGPAATGLLDVNPGETWTVSLYSRSSTTHPLLLGYRFADASAWTAGTVWESRNSTTIWDPHAVTFTVPAGSTRVALALRSNTANLPAGATVDATALLVTRTPAEVPYFDGDTPGAAWTGTAHGSPSVDVEPAATGAIASFAGRVAEMRARPHTTHGTVYQITALDYTVDLSASLVGGTAFPAETAEARSDRILAAIGQTPPAGLAPDPGGSVAARDAAAVSARDLLLETLAHGVTTDKARWIVTSDVNQETGALDVVPYSYRPVRRAVYAIDVLDPCVIDGGAEWVRSRRSAADWITIDHPGGPTVYGNPTGVPLPPLKTDQTDPTTLAAFLLDNVAGHTWDGGTLRLHVHDPAAKPVWGMVAGWFDYGLGRAVVVPDIPAPQAPGGTTRYAGMIAAARFTIPTDGRPVVDFRLRADVPNDSYQVTRWSDVPVGTTWANVGAATWADYEPGGASGGQGSLTTRWSDVPGGTTWATIDPTVTWFDYRTTPKP